MQFNPSLKQKDQEILTATEYNSVYIQFIYIASIQNTSQGTLQENYAMLLMT